MTAKLVRTISWIEAAEKHFAAGKVNDFTVSHQVLKVWFDDFQHSEMTLVQRVKGIASDHGWHVSFNPYGHASITKRL